MSSNKRNFKGLSITFPKSNKSQLQRMRSYDSDNTPSPSPVEVRNRRELSAEGLARARVFQLAHSRSSASSSVSSTCSSLTPGPGQLRFSDDYWCSSPSEQLCSPTSPITPIRKIINSTSELSPSCSTEERLIDWPGHHNKTNKNSRKGFDASYQRRSRSSDSRHYVESFSDEEDPSAIRLCLALTMPRTPKSPTARTVPISPASTDSHKRRSQFRRAWSLFSLSGDKDRERQEKPSQKKILRPPTRHYYKRGLSGLPIQCSSRHLGLAC